MSHFRRMPEESLGEKVPLRAFDGLEESAGGPPPRVLASGVRSADPRARLTYMRGGRSCLAQLTAPSEGCLSGHDPGATCQRMSRGVLITNKLIPNEAQGLPPQTELFVPVKPRA